MASKKQLENRIKDLNDFVCNLSKLIYDIQEQQGKDRKTLAELGNYITCGLLTGHKIVLVRFETFPRVCGWLATFKCKNCGLTYAKTKPSLTAKERNLLKQLGADI